MALSSAPLDMIESCFSSDEMLAASDSAQRHIARLLDLPALLHDAQVAELRRSQSYASLRDTLVLAALHAVGNHQLTVTEQLMAAKAELASRYGRVLC